MKKRIVTIKVKGSTYKFDLGVLRERGNIPRHYDLELLKNDGDLLGDLISGKLYKEKKSAKREKDNSAD